MLLLLAAVVLFRVGVSTPSHCGLDPLPTNPQRFLCSEYYNCTANAGENITIPCGTHPERSGVSFTYYIHYHNATISSQQVTTEFLNVLVTADKDRSYVSCTPNNSVDSSCYGLDILYRPQELPQGVTVPLGYRNNRYCLSCQIEANPPPNCSWTIYTTEMVPYQCQYSATCPTVNPVGVTFPDSPGEACQMTSTLPRPLYPGCVMEIDQLTPKYKHYKYFCTAENPLGTHTVNFLYRPIPFTLCGSQAVTVELTPAPPEVNVTIGDNETLDCHVTNVEPGGCIFWFHNDTAVEGDIQSNYSEETCNLESTLMLSNISYSDGGTYICLFRDNTVSATQKKMLFVRVNPRDQPTSSTDGKNILMIIVAACTSGGIVLVLLVVFFLVVFAYMSSNSIRFFLKWRLKEPEYVYVMNGKRIPFEYDVFLSFAEADMTEVEDNLRHPLERKGYCVCWHHTDFLPGKQIAENIEENITASRKTIVVLSSDFFKSSHCRRELDFALQKLKKTKTCCVVPVLLRECGKLPSDIAALTYLDATNNTKGEKLINRLFNGLGKPQKDVALPVQSIQ